MYAIKTVSRNKYFKYFYTVKENTRDVHLHIVYADKLEKAHIFDDLDSAIYNMMLIAFGVPIKYFMEMHFCIVEVKNVYKEL